MTERSVAGSRVVVLVGDITDQDVDAIVNAANRHLQHGGGVAAAIARAGGPAIQAESDRHVDRHGPLEAGQAAVTGGGELPARWVVHVAGPVYDEHPAEESERLLRQAVSAALDAAAREGARTVALPAISSGVYGYPRAEATGIIAAEAHRWLEQHESALDEVRLVGFDQATADDFAAALDAD